MRNSRIFEVFEQRKGKRTSLYTQNLVPGKKVYGEDLVTMEGVEYREWNHNRSKLAAAILKGSPNIGMRKGDTVLYLGASSGTTPSHVSDIVGKKGFVFALDFAPRVVRQLVYLCEERENITPILGDANKPDTYADKVCLVDVVYMDIAQRNQEEIFLKNCKAFLKKEGYALLAVKARSIDVTKKPRQIFEKVRKVIEKELTIIDSRILDPFEKDHCMFICKKK
ncbi:MAG: fibrillarin-like rRNA/tRNA 2'-O-methyltransferase [Nanoarchaeota archaeon]|nr:fibrillarin-like rRNA/tRNA 2'-O-methyltransferase [Nanoarchaeota archaeon]MCK5629342.1 fibrillarin-like rRNA/tRNA 2'-O-methyltransferase [Nanoarchaeota archaeon]